MEIVWDWSTDNDATTIVWRLSEIKLEHGIESSKYPTPNFVWYGLFTDQDDASPCPAEVTGFPVLSFYAPPWWNRLVRSVIPTAPVDQLKIFSQAQLSHFISH